MTIIMFAMLFSSFRNGLCMFNAHCYFVYFVAYVIATELFTRKYHGIYNIRFVCKAVKKRDQNGKDKDNGRDRDNMIPALNREY